MTPILIHEIQNKGQLMLVSYGDTKPFIEYSLKEEYRNQGIMSKELPNFLKLCKENGYNQLLANVKKNNEISIKLLERNGFVKVMDFEDSFAYITDLNHSREVVNKIVNKINLTNKN